MAAGFWSPYAINATDGPTTTAASAATVLPVDCKFSFLANSFPIPQILHVHATGRISCVVTTPGTARLDLRYGGVVFYDTGALNLNIVAKVTVPWTFDAMLHIRVRGSAANFFGMGWFVSEAIIASPLPTVGGNGFLNAPTGTPAVGANIDLTAAGAFDMQFTQTVTTGSFTVHNFFAEGISMPSP